MKNKPAPWLLLLLFALLLVGFAPAEQGIQRFKEIVVQVLTVTGNAELRGNLAVTGNTTVTGDLTVDDVTADDLTVTHLTGRSLFLQYQDVAQAPSIYAAASVVSTTNSITTSILGIDTPRNLVISLSSDAQRAAGNITVTGVDARGAAATEVLAMTAITDAQTLTGVVPWVSVSGFSLPAQTVAITFSVAGGQKFGLPILPEAAGDLYHLTVAATPQAAPTVNATYGTFDPVATPAAGVDYDVWLKQ